MRMRLAPTTPRMGSGGRPEERRAAVPREGQTKGEFRKVDPLHFNPSMIAMIVFYFTNAPVMRLVTGRDPFSAEFLAQRRAAVLDFISAALFQQPDERSRK